MTSARTRWVAAALAACVVVVGACKRDGGSKENARQNLLEPRFAPDDALGAAGDGAGGSSTTAAGGAAGAPGAGAGSGAAGSRPPAQVAAPVIAGATTAAISDRVGDLTPSPLDPPPPWADLAGATMIRRESGFELRIQLGGGTAPSGTDDDHTMNIASFFDVDGDGGIDFEVWANLASGGWGASYFDNTGGGGGGFLDDSGVTVAPEGAEVVLRFPLAHLKAAQQFRWGLASEWGRYEVLGTAAMARDDAPDNDAAARFPG